MLCHWQKCIKEHESRHTLTHAKSRKWNLNREYDKYRTKYAMRVSELASQQKMRTTMRKVKKNDLKSLYS